MSNLDELMQKIQLDYVSDEPAVRLAIKDFLFSAIGENEPLTGKTTKCDKPNYGHIQSRNRLRKKQREYIDLEQS